MTRTGIPPLTWADVPPAEKKRLRDREAAQRRETAKAGLPALPVSVEGLWLIQRGMCTCNVCEGKVPLNPFTQPGDPDRIVIAHPRYRAGKGSPGHVPTNVSLWSDACNKREAPLEASAFHRGNRHAVTKILAVDKPERKSRGNYKAIPQRENPWPTGRKLPTKKDRERIVK